MAARRSRLHAFESYEQTLQGIGVIGLLTAVSREAAAGLSHLCFRVTAELFNALICLLMGEGPLRVGHFLDCQRLLDFYCVLASVAPLLQCLLGWR